ncbi:MAG: roadblock/LC7 domain-containing protein [Thaumarchaeota archaeon]|jgi:hypothetical protein|nr:roadblock/LC7 domain-containing protein [Nitrososphaerota archaeon]
MNLCDEILNLDKGIRFVAIMSKSGKVIDSKVREDVKGRELMPIHVLEAIGATMSRTVWSVAKSFSRYFGENLRVVFHHERLDFVVMEIKGNIIAFTTDKDVITDNIARRIRKIYLEASEVPKQC